MWVASTQQCKLTLFAHILAESGTCLQTEGPFFVLHQVMCCTQHLPSSSGSKSVCASVHLCTRHAVGAKFLTMLLTHKYGAAHLSGRCMVSSTASLITHRSFPSMLGTAGVPPVAIKMNLDCSHTQSCQRSACFCSAGDHQPPFLDPLPLHDQDHHTTSHHYVTNHS